jgi:hypothetical protein
MEEEDPIGFFDKLYGMARKQLRERKGLYKRPNTKQAISDLEENGWGLIPWNGNKRYKQIKYRAPKTKYQKLMHEGMGGQAPDSLRRANHTDGPVDGHKPGRDCDSFRSCIKLT